MSRLYQMDFQVDVTSLTEEEIDKVKEEIETIWGIDEDDMNVGVEQFDSDDHKKGDKILWAAGENYLGGGEGEQEFADRASRQIWEKVGCFVPVRVCATYLENLPHEDYDFDESDYKEWKELWA